MKLRYQKCLASKAFKEPMQKVNESYMLLDNIVKSIEYNIKNKVKDKKVYMVANIAKLDTLSPLKTLTRGYSIAEHDGKIVNSAKVLKTGDEIKLKFVDGVNTAKITDTSTI